MVEEKFVPIVDDKQSYIKVYRMQATGADGDTVRVSVPREIVEKEARRLDLSIKEFAKHYRIQWLYNGFEGAWAKFISKEDKPNAKNNGS